MPHSRSGQLALLGSAAVLGGSLWKLLRAAAGTSDESTGARLLQGFVGGAIQSASAVLAHKMTGATVNALGGKGAFTGHGDKFTGRIVLNAPTPNLVSTTTHARGGSGEGGGHGATTTTTMAPAFDQQHLASYEMGQTGDGYYVNLYREDPVSGKRVGAPVKSFNLNFTGSTPASIQNLQNGFARTISGLADAMLYGKSVSRPPLIVQRRPGRPPLRSYKPDTGGIHIGPHGEPLTTDRMLDQ